MQALHSIIIMLNHAERFPSLFYADHPINIPPMINRSNYHLPLPNFSPLSGIFQNHEAFEFPARTLQFLFLITPHRYTSLHVLQVHLYAIHLSEGEREKKTFRKLRSVE